MLGFLLHLLRLWVQVKPFHRSLLSLYTDACPWRKSCCVCAGSSLVPGSTNEELGGIELPVPMTDPGPLSEHVNLSCVGLEQHQSDIAKFVHLSHCVFICAFKFAKNDGENR